MDKTIKEIEAIRASYEILFDASDFNVGDIVKVVRKADDYELGWNNCWVYEMDEMVGKEYEIKVIERDRNICLENEDYILFDFPFFVLEKVYPIKKEFDYKYVCEKLKPFDKVLVRDEDDGYWGISFFEKYSTDNEDCLNFYCLGDAYGQCLPYEGFEIFLGTRKNPGVK